MAGEIGGARAVSTASELSGSITGPASAWGLTGRSDSGPIKVLDLELRGELRALAGCGGYRTIRILLRRAGRPIEWITLSHDGSDEVAAERLAADLAHSSAVSSLDGLNDPEDQVHVVPHPAPGISVVVPTRDRPEQLRDCLASILRIRYPSLEIVVVDNQQASDATRQAVSGMPIRYVQEPRPGVSNARNRGIAEARHDIIAFTDDDARPDPQWLQAIAARFSDPDVTLVTGLVAPAELETPAQRLFELACGGMGKGLVPRTVRWDDLDVRSRIRVQDMGAGANMAFRRGFLEAVGGFDPSLGAGTPARGGEDLEMFHRVLASGHTVSYEPSAIVWHVHRRSMPELVAQLGDTGCAFRAYLRTLARTSTLSRWEVARYGLLPWSAWLLGRFVKRATGHHPRPFGLLWAELCGALSVPRPLATELKRVMRA